MITHLVPRAALAGEALWLEEEAYRHLIRARRLEVGNRLRVVDGQDQARWGILETIEKRRARVRLEADAPRFEPRLNLELLVASLRRERASWLVEKATEIGVSGIRFLHTERAPRSFGSAQMERFKRVAIAALEQCHRTRLPRLDGVHPWTELPTLLARREARFYLRPGSQLPLASTDLPAAPPPAHVAILIGPEGGFTEEEHEELEALGCLPRHLGERILRIETAALVSAARLLEGER